jgi:hypothetical protein
MCHKQFRGCPASACYNVAEEDFSKKGGKKSITFVQPDEIDKMRHQDSDPTLNLKTW